MQEEQINNLLTLNILDVDSQLIKLFKTSEQIQNSKFSQVSNHHPSRTFSFDYIQIKFAQLQKGYDSDNSPEKKHKNKKIKKRKMVLPPKVEANKDRATTKFYIQSLQNRIQQLELEVDRLKNLNKMNLDYIKKINDSELIINGFYQHRQKIIQKLQVLSSAQKPNLYRIKSEWASLRKKHGAYGTDRIKAIQYYFKQLIEMIGTNSHKYLAEAALKNSDLFNPTSIDTWQDWRKQLFQQLNLSPQILARFSEMRSQVLGLHTKFNKKLLEMYSNKCNLLEISHQIENLYQQMSKSLSPLQTGRLLCFLEKYKFQSNFYASDSIKKMYEQLSDHTRFSYEDQDFV